MNGEGTELPPSALLHALRFSHMRHDYAIVARPTAGLGDSGPWQQTSNRAQIRMALREYLSTESPSIIADFIEQTGFHRVSAHEAPSRRLLHEISNGDFIVLQNRISTMRALDYDYEGSQPPPASEVETVDATIDETIDEAVEPAMPQPAATPPVASKEGMDKLYNDAPHAKAEIDDLADEIADKHGGKVAKAPLKNRETATNKINKKYGGDPTKIKDVARNTIIVPADQIEAVTADLAASGANIKVIDGATDSHGYSGVNSTMKTKTGIVAEIQVNSPEMIYAKEPEPLARQLLGDQEYDAIAKKTGVPGGKGHKYYEQSRALPDSDPGHAAIQADSKAYYNSVRGS